MTLERKAELVKFHTDTRRDALVYVSAFEQAIAEIDVTVERAYSEASA
jgi:hypothetical protein